MRPLTTAGQVYGPGAGSAFQLTKGVTTGTAGSNATASISQATTAPVPVTTVFGNLQSSVIASPILWLFAFVLFLVAWKLVEEHRGGREIYHEVKIGGSNIVKIGIVALIFFAIARFITARYNIPGFSSFVQFATGSGSATSTSGSMTPTG